MTYTITKNIVLLDNQGNIIKDLKSGMTARVRIQTVSRHKLYDKEFSNTINKNKQGE